MNPGLAVVLYAEDSDDDAFLMRRAFAKLKFPGRLVIVPDGMEAKLYMEGAGPYADRERHPLPQIILLDVKMPRLSGLELLQWLRTQEEFRPLPVFMLTSSSQPSDIAAAYEHGANSYLVKPTNLNDFSSLVDGLAALCGPGPKSPLATIPGALPRPG